MKVLHHTYISCFFLLYVVCFTASPLKIIRCNSQRQNNHAATKGAPGIYYLCMVYVDYIAVYQSYVIRDLNCMRTQYYTCIIYIYIYVYIWYYNIYIYISCLQMSNFHMILLWWYTYVYNIIYGPGLVQQWQPRGLCWRHVGAPTGPTVSLFGAKAGDLLGRFTVKWMDTIRHWKFMEIHQLTTNDDKFICFINKNGNLLNWDNQHNQQKMRFTVTDNHYLFSRVNVVEV